MEPQFPQPNLEMSPLERLETAVDSMTLAQEKNTKVLEGVEPVMEALIAAYLKGTKEIQTAISSIQEYVSTIEPVAINQEALGYLQKLDKTFSKKDLFKIPKPEVIQDSKETLKAIRELIRAVDEKPLEVNLSNDFTKLEKSLSKIEQLIKFEVPLDGGRVAVKLSDTDLERLTKAINVPWQMNGTATEDTLAKIPGLAIPLHDQIAMTYTGNDLTGVVYKLQGRVVATLTLTYSSGNLINVTKS